ncbi:hypothetical protein TNCV_2834721 [Trichonephila clavipes]|nr:hypothetical protein TNCV_2834721 [Trichonephila clavipes]
MVELYDQNELHIEQEVQQISLEALKIAQKCPVTVVTHVGAPVAWGPRIIDMAVVTPLIMASLIRIFRRSLKSSLEISTFTIDAAVYLHKFIKSAEEEIYERRYCSSNFADMSINAGRGLTEEALSINRLRQAGSNTYCRQAEEIRSTLKNYFSHRSAKVG